MYSDIILKNLFITIS